MDPENKDEILQQLEKIKDSSLEDFSQFVDSIFPHWVILVCDRYSSDYDFLTRNWHKICDILHVKPQKIILVDEIVFDDDHTVIKEICEILTKKGFVVRRAEEFVACPHCQSIIPVKPVWEVMRAKNLPVPEKWSQYCQSCC